MDINVPNELCQVHIKVALLMGYIHCTVQLAKLEHKLTRKDKGTIPA